MPRSCFQPTRHTYALALGTPFLRTLALSTVLLPRKPESLKPIIIASPSTRIQVPGEEDVTWTRVCRLADLQAMHRNGPVPWLFDPKSRN